MKKIYCTAFLIAIIISGCIPSLHPIYTEKDRMIEDKILGKWELINDDVFSPFSTWTFERAANLTATFKVEGGSGMMNYHPGALSFLNGDITITQNDQLPYYFLTHRQYNSGDTLKSIMIVNLTEIAGDIYMDFYPYTMKEDHNISRFASNFINGHTFAKMELEDDRIKIYSFNLDYMTELIKEKRIRLKHENLGEDQIVLTASTKELRAFIAKYGDDKRLYEEAEYLVQDYQ